MANGLLIPSVNAAVNDSIHSLSSIKTSSFQNKGRRAARIALMKMGFSKDQIDQMLFEMGYRK